MRGIVHKRRAQGFFAMALCLSTVYLFDVSQSYWVKNLAEEKIAVFLARKVDVKIGSITDGVFKDMVLENVEFLPRGDAGGKGFGVDRMEISYRWWEAIARKFKLPIKEERSLRYIAVYFDKENPFIQGFVKVSSFSDRIELFGHVAPVFLGDYGKRAFKGVLYKREDGKYACDIMWNGEINVKGVLDPIAKELELEFLPLHVSGSELPLSLSGKMDENGDLSIYVRLDKAKLRGADVMADIRVNYINYDIPEFSIKVENLIINEQPYWDFSLAGSLHDDGKRLFLREVRWGENFFLRGELNLEAPYDADLELLIKELDLQKFFSMIGQKELEATGILNGEIKMRGPLKAARLDSRLRMGEASVINVKFTSAFAHLKGQFPVIKVVDGKVMKEDGRLIMGGEIDFRKNKNSGIFENITFEPDNKVFVWENWQM